MQKTFFSSGNVALGSRFVEDVRPVQSRQLQTLGTPPFFNPRMMTGHQHGRHRHA
jgi:hypothetical protein